MAGVMGLFDTTGFTPRWESEAWPRGLGWTHLVSDLLIFGAYMAIPIALGYFVLRRRNVPFTFIFWLFFAFILCCGLTHLISAIVFYKPVYRFAGLMKACTAIVSWTTVIALIRVIPDALRLPDIKAANQRMFAEIEQRRSAQDELERTREVLESRSGELTVHTHRMRQAMEAAWVMAAQWCAETGDIRWEIGGRRWLRELQPDSNASDVDHWNQVMPPDVLARFLDACRAAVETDTAFEFEAGVLTPDGEALRVRVGAAPDRRVAGEHATITGMARLI